MDAWSKQIRSGERFKEIPSAAILLFKEEEAFFRSRSLPVDCYVVKPMDFNETDAIIRDLKYFLKKILQPKTV